MKLVIIQCAEAHHHELEQIFNAIPVNSYSEMPVSGFMKSVDGTTNSTNWFGSSKNPYRYILAYTFLETGKVGELLRRITAFNQNANEISPIRAYVTAIEKSV